MNSEPVGIKKFGMTMSISSELLWDHLAGQRFPRRHHVITHPITDAERAEYESFVHTWESTAEKWQQLQTEGERRGWATSEGGYDREPAVLRELKPRPEVIYDETVEEWRARVTPIIEHHHKTGVWLEQPEPTFIEQMTRIAPGLVEERKDQ